MNVFICTQCVSQNPIQVAKTVELIKTKGGKVTREPGPVKGGSTVIAFVEDPDGYKFELIERGPTREPLCQVMLRVRDLDRAIDFYKKVNNDACFLRLIFTAWFVGKHTVNIFNNLYLS